MNRFKANSTETHRTIRRMREIRWLGSYFGRQVMWLAEKNISATARYNAFDFVNI